MKKNNKRIASIVIFVFAFTLFSFAQVAINTQTPDPSADLTLGSTDKGFLPNRVALTSSTDITTVPNPKEGMVVYNTNATSTLAEGMAYYSGSNWTRLIDKVSRPIFNLFYLSSDVSSRLGGANILNGAKLTFPDITIPEDGIYIFIYNLYGSLSGANLDRQRAYFYLGIASGGVVSDVAELDVLSGTPSTISYSIVLGGSFKKGEVVNTYLSTGQSIRWTLHAGSDIDNPSKTYLSWAKL